jgi:vacuolar-type H+-ATPase subunit C/Vma6
MPYTLESTVGDILKDPRAREIMEKYAPGVASNPMIGMAKNWSIKNIMAMPQAKSAGLTEEKVQQVLDEINKLEG